jgi:putative transposase
MRLPDYDYAQAGAYFVTVCTKERVCLFGDLADAEMRLNTVGQIVQSCWNDLPRHYPHVELDESVVMPNHVHGIIVIVDSHVGAQHAAPLQPHVDVGARVNVAPGSLGAVIRSFKSAVTRQINESPNAPITNPWQRGYYEHIIRNGRDLARIRQYITNNPENWTKDEYYPDVEGGPAVRTPAETLNVG